MVFPLEGLTIVRSWRFFTSKVPKPCNVTVSPSSKQLPMKEMMEQADIVSLHCPVTDKSKGLINKETLSYMKPTAFLINEARGPVVVSQDLADALNSGKIAGAGIDVFENEPPLDTNHPLLHAKNTIVTPHVAFATAESMAKRAVIVFDNIDAYLAGNQKNIIL